MGGGGAEVVRAMKKLKRGRATGVDEVQVEMLVMTECVGVRWLRRLLNTCRREGKTPEEWRTGLIDPVWKKGDVFDFHFAESCPEGVRNDYGWKDKEDSGV